MRYFVRHGWRVSGCGRNAAAIDGLLKDFPEEQRGVLEVVDVGDDGAVQAFAGKVFGEFGAPDLLVNNAGLIHAPGKLWEIPDLEFSAVVDVNLRGVANCLRHFAPPMVARGSGVMVNLSSGWGRSTSPGVAPYCATKWAVEGLSQAMSQELPAGLAVVALNPGVINTDMLRTAFGTNASDYETAGEWAERAGPFLAGLDASANGRQLTVP